MDERLATDEELKELAGTPYKRGPYKTGNKPYWSVQCFKCGATVGHTCRTSPAGQQLSHAYSHIRRMKDYFYAKTLRERAPLENRYQMTLNEWLLSDGDV